MPPDAPAPAAESFDTHGHIEDPLVKTLVWVVAGVILIVAVAAALVVIRSVAGAIGDVGALAGLLALGWCAGLTFYLRRLAARDRT